MVENGILIVILTKQTKTGGLDDELCVFITHYGAWFWSFDVYTNPCFLIFMTDPKNSGHHKRIKKGIK